MKIVTVITSPRRTGNCRQIADIILKQALDKDATNNTYFVEDMNIRGCQACRACKNLEKPTKCVLNDDFNKIMNEVEKSDAFIFAAPNYFGEINGQGRIFMDRFYSMTKTTPNQLKNRPKCIVIHTYGASDDHYTDYITKKSKIFKSIGCGSVEVVSVGKNRPSKGNNYELIKRLENLGKQLVETD